MGGGKKQREGRGERLGATEVEEVESGTCRPILVGRRKRTREQKKGGQREVRKRTYERVGGCGVREGRADR